MAAKAAACQGGVSPIELAAFGCAVPTSDGSAIGSWFSLAALPGLAPGSSRSLARIGPWFNSRSLFLSVSFCCQAVSRRIESL